MELECYKIYNVAPEIVPGRSQREWMDAFPDRHPYRCLPLTMANSTGWEILCPMRSVIARSYRTAFARGKSPPIPPSWADSLLATRQNVQ